MIPHVHVREVKTGGVTNKKTFGISTNAKMFQILSSGIYKNKVLAPVRECSCNAYDSHVAVGKEEVPIEVHLPTALEAWFSVEDFGLGLSHEEVMNLYTTYGMSTKENSNDFIGALGLGSKSPFAYTDSYSVVSTFNGVRRNYGCYIDGKGEPQISCIGDGVSTNDVNGLKVSFNTKKGDDYAFLEAAREFFKYFPTKPDFNMKVDIEKPEYLFKGDGWAIIKREEGRYYGYNANLSYAIMGSVCYPIDMESMKLKGQRQYATSIFPGEERDRKAKAILSEGVILWFKLGDLDIASSREELGYNDETIKTIIDKTVSVHEELVKKMEGDFVTCTTYWEAITKYYEVQKQMSSHFKDVIKTVHWKGQPLSQRRATIEGVGLSLVQQYDTRRRKRLSFYSDGAPHMPGPETPNTIVLYADQHEERVVHIHARILKWVRETHPDKNILVVWPRPCDGTESCSLLGNTVKTKTEAQVIKDIGSPPYEVISKVVPLYEGEFSTTKNGKRTISKFYTHDGRRSSYGGSYGWNEATVDVSTTKGFYINLLNWEPVNESFEVLGTLKRLCVSEGLIQPDFSYYGVPGTYRKFLDNRVKYPDWEDAGVYLKNLLKQRTKTKKFKRLLEADIFESVYDRGRCPKELFGTEWRETSDESDRASKIANYSLDKEEKESIIEPYRAKLTERYNGIIKKYPLLKHLNCIDDEVYKDFLVYKKQVDELRKLNLD